MNRTVFTLDGKRFVFVSEHPLEERITELTDDYRGPDGTFILPEAKAWDGVVSHPNLVIGLPDDGDQP